MPWITTKDGRKVNTDWFADDERQKQEQIAENQRQADKLNGKNNIEIDNAGKLDKEILDAQVNSLEAVSKQFPQVQTELEKMYGHGLKVSVVSKGETSDDVAPGYTKREDGIIRLNSSNPPFNGNISQAVSASERFGRKGKFGSTLSSSALGHTAIHEYAHLMQYAFQHKENVSITEATNKVLSTAMSRAGMKELPKTISSYANKNHFELISECVADAYFNKDKANSLSLEIYKLYKESLG